MKLSIFRFICIALVICVSGCNNKGAAAPAPTNVVVTPGDTSATVTWDMVPGVQYFGWWAPVTSLSPESCSTVPTCLAVSNISSPYVISNLVNGTTYAVTVNGRTNGGPGGPGSPSQIVTPRLAGTNLAGASWTPGSASTFNLRGVIYGTGNQFVAAGDSGALYGSTNGTSWTALTNPLPSVNFKAVANAGGTYLVAGAGGVILYSPDYAVTWTQMTSNTPYDLNSLYGYGTTIFIAVGNNGTILTSDASGTVWTNRTSTSGTTNHLHGVTYGNGTYVAVGDAGTLLTSTDSVNWHLNTTTAAQSTDTFQSVAYGVITTAATINSTSVVAVGTPVFVIVGASGVVLYSVDGTNWTRTSAGSNTINAVTFGDHFIAVDSVGNIFSSVDGEIWSSTPAQTATAGLNAIAPGPTPFGTYTAVGVGGLTMYAQ